VGEVPLPELKAIKKSAKLKGKVRLVDKDRRPVVLADLGCVVEGSCMPHADPHDPHTTLAGVAKRFAIKPPEPDGELVLKFKRFVRAWIGKNLVPLAPDSNTSIEAWLASTNYPFHRKEELAEKFKRCEGRLDPRKHYKCKSFMKDECYPEYKHARAINSRSDEFKCKVGPIFRLIEKVVFQNKAFIKRIPVSDRPRYILDMLKREGAIYMATDYTAYESLFTGVLMDACEFQLYDYMTQYLPEHTEFMGLMREVLGGENVCEFKHFTVSLDATRMSGEMCTSLGNGFSNLMFMLFMCTEAGCKNVSGVVEGDDGLFTMIGTPPSSELFARLGLVIKVEIHTNIEEASFCGLIFDVFDCLNVTDPRDVLASIGWSSARYAKSNTNKRKTLLRCKALSAAYQYPGCPIVAALAEYILRVTKSHDTRHMISQWKNTYERTQLIEAQDYGYSFIYPPLNTRLLVEKKYGISIEHQVCIEKYFDSLDELQHLCHPIIDLYMPVVWKQYWNNYVLSVCEEYPGARWVQCKEFKLKNPLSAT